MGVLLWKGRVVWDYMNSLITSLAATPRIQEWQWDNDAYLGDFNLNLGQSAHNGRLREEGGYFGSEMMYVETRGIFRLVALEPR